MSNVLVTGGAGFVGSHACKALAAAGFLPITYDNLSLGHRHAIRWGPFEHGDISDRFRLRTVIEQYAPAAILHFAASAYVGESVVDPAKYYRNNVAGSLMLLEAMRDTGLDKLVFSSSCASYGIPQELPITEETPQSPINPYGASKLMVERMIDDFANAYGGRHVILRYFNAAGADPDGEIGEDHDPETHIIPLAIDAALGVRDSFSILGADYPTADGTCVRDYVHVSDLADAHVKALQALLSGKPSAAYNLGNGKGFSVREIIAAVAEAADRPIKTTVVERRPGDPPTLISDATKARTELGWAPRFGDIEDIVRTAYLWRSKLVNKQVSQNNFA